MPPGRYDRRRIQVMRLMTKFWWFPARRRALLLEAVAILSLVSTALALLPFKRAIRLGAVRLGRVSGSSAAEIVSAIEMVARRLPWRIVCIQKGIAAQLMLRRRGFDARLHYGIGNDGDTLGAHAWVSLDEVPVTGGEEARVFAPVGAFP